MRYIIPCVEQLDHAAEELRRSNPVNSRLALILTDNVIELTCHRQCQEIINWDRDGSWLDKPKYRQRQRRRVLGRYFDQKISFLRSEKLLSSDEQEFVLIAHKYRNEAYHIGLHDDSIIWSIAREYHALACDLFSRLKPNWIVSTSLNLHTERVERHLKKIGVQTLSHPHSDIEKLAASISEECPPANRSLAEALSEALLEELEELDLLFQFLVSNNPNQLDGNAILRHIQYFDEIIRELQKTELFPSDADYQTEGRRVQAKLERTWSPQYDRIPLLNWRRRARNLGKEGNPLRALKQFESVCLDKDYLAEVVRNAASELDACIQLEIDRARGK